MGSERGFTTGERFTSLFEPDTLIPQEYLETFKRRTHLQPEKRLMLAVLEDGVACFQKYVAATDTKGKKYFQESEEWILEEPSERVFCFANVCETLALNANYLRHGLMQWKAATLENRPTARIYQLMSSVAQENDSPPPPHQPRKVATR